MESRNFRYVPEIDQLRGLAALLILFYHGLHLFRHSLTREGPFVLDGWMATSNPLLAVIVEGYGAVALFMVLSGFIFAYGLGQANVDYWQFVRNRFLRTYPLFVFMLFLGIATHAGNFNLQGFFLTLFFMANSPGALELGPFTAMFWAVAVEWQFYLLFPFLLVFVRQGGLRFVGGLVVLFVALRLLASLYDASLRDLAYWTIVGRLEQFLIGVWLGVRLSQRGIPVLPRPCWVLLAAAGGVMVYSLLLNRAGGWFEDGLWRAFWPAVEGSAWAGFMVLFLGSARALPRWLGAVLVRVGVLSYSVYLLHVLIIDSVIRLGWLVAPAWLGVTGAALVTTLVVVLPVVLAISYLSFNAIEKPFLGLRHRYARE
ncbi:MAG: acyltransferase [Rhodocyclaceae bacterium]